MSGQATNSSLTMTTNLTDQEMNIRLSEVTEFSLKKFTELRDLDFYRSRIMGPNDTAGNLYGFNSWEIKSPFNFNLPTPEYICSKDTTANLYGLKVLEKRDPSKFDMPFLTYTCSKEQDNNEIDITQTRRILARYTEHQENEAKFSELELKCTLHVLKDLIGPWLPSLSFELHESPPENLGAVIEECLAKILVDSDLQAIKTGLVKLYAELEIFRLKQSSS